MLLQAIKQTWTEAEREVWCLELYLGRLFKGGALSDRHCRVIEKSGFSNLMYILENVWVLLQYLIVRPIFPSHRSPACSVSISLRTPSNTHDSAQSCPSIPLPCHYPMLVMYNSVTVTLPSTAVSAMVWTVSAPRSWDTSGAYCPQPMRLDRGELSDSGV